MAYSTSTTITLLLPGLPQTATSAGHSTTIAVIEQHIARADNLINSMIAQRYNVSGFVTTVPPMLKTISEDITSYYSYRSFFSGDNQNSNDWTGEYKEAMNMLERIRSGNQDLVNSDGSLVHEIETSAIDRIESTTEDYQPFFDEDGPTDWAVDSNKLNDIKDNR